MLLPGIGLKLVSVMNPVMVTGNMTSVAEAGRDWHAPLAVLVTLTV
jgi:hypothetical protein